MRLKFALLSSLLIVFWTQSAIAQPDIDLPFMAGDACWCAQGWDGSYSHSDEAAWDYNRSDGDYRYPLLAPGNGTIVFAGRAKKSDGTNSPYGNVVLIDYGNGYYGRLAHNASIVVRVGEIVKQGQVVSFCGGTGVSDNSYSSHIHYNTQKTSNPASKDYTEVKVDYMDYQGRIINNGYPTPCNCQSNAPSSTYYTSVNSGVFDREFSANGGSSKFGSYQNTTGTYKGIHWWHGWKYSDLYGIQNTARRCYIQDYDGGSWGACAIVYDALGGARKAYTVRTGFWSNAQGNGFSQTQGPQGPLGMPITNEYANGTNRARQDFQRGYLFYNGSTGVVTFNLYPKCAPGMTSAGWNPVISYKIARYYETHGARNYWGEPTGFAYNVSGTTWRQYFSGGSVAGPLAITINENSVVAKLNADFESEESPTATLPSGFCLHQNYPNPFNPTTTISYSLPVTTDIRLDIFNILGQKVQTLVDERQSAGEHSVLWNSDGFSSGIYLYRIQTAEATATRKMILLK